TSANSPRSFLHRSIREKPDTIKACSQTHHENKPPSTPGFSTKSGPFGHSLRLHRQILNLADCSQRRWEAA
ncbi:hypothetical protein, partial [Paracoccus sp. M683]|uniref:hypothetical protein n=1 Tax=Paracoccus sp. M683 TaxID=2594268 RepID=UPI001C8F35CD